MAANERSDAASPAGLNSIPGLLARHLYVLLAASWAAPALTSMFEPPADGPALKMFRSVLALLVIGILSRPAFPETPGMKLRGHAREVDAIACVESVENHSKRTLDAVARDINRGRLTEAAVRVSRYRDHIQACKATLETNNLDPVNHPEGYKRLEISLRQSLHRLNGLLVSTNYEEGPLRLIKRDLDELHRALIQDLFPDAALAITRAVSGTGPSRATSDGLHATS